MCYLDNVQEPAINLLRLKIILTTSAYFPILNLKYIKAISAILVGVKKIAVTA